MKKVLSSSLSVTHFRTIIPFSKSLVNVGWLFFDKIFRMATGMIVGIWLARYLGPSEYGLLNYVNVFPLILAPLASLGVNNILVSEIPIQNVEAVDRLVRTTVSLKFLSGLISFFLILIACNIIHASNQQLILLISISSLGLIVQCFDAVDVYFQSIQKIHYSIIPKVISFSLTTAVRIYGLTAHYHLSFFIAISICDILISYLTIYWIYLTQHGHSIFSFLFDKAIVQRLIQLAWPLMLAEFFIFIYMRIDQLMLKYLADSHELGRYSAALRLSEVWYFVAGAITMSFYPSIIALRAHDYNGYLNRYQKLLNILAVCGITIGIVFSILANGITSMLYGPEYEGVGPILSIHIWTGLFVFIAVGTNNWFIVENMQRFLLGRTIMGAVVNAGLNLFLIPLYGAIGASVATLLAQLCAAYLTNGLYSRTKEVFELQSNALLFVPRFLISRLRQIL
ncbi:flippase [Spirosoma endophyticum]|uniref:Polysaccharide biosynthesis C-terminal domain-containing protein n=1 Tax=Spirosoma endophyticum TaxID=662367 RepID=A0A1I1TAX9_9BACT|nr:flippase [Spirosoma endophyticum]SFD55771.1 Polysaccharide biosynthesis C-terminal domain-containing protein [Spirosoma endophyticum]